ncbi:MAG: hypothetical protein GC152_03670 [Alphaproteobacteria bacterium]|nr:hypothetical protein [Alphaproteobacteria bacterium]
MSIHITFPNTLATDVDLASLPWETLWAMSHSDLSSTLVRVGKEAVKLGELCAVDWIADDAAKLTIVNSTAAVHGIATRLKSGQVFVQGNAGQRAAVDMTGGHLIVQGDVGDDLAGASPGKTAGMRGGEIHVFGNAGQRAGARLRRGILAITGSVAEDCGCDALAGTIIVLGRKGARAGVGMKRASLIVFSPEGLDELRFIAGATSLPTWLRVYFRSLAAKGFTVPQIWNEGPFQRFTGDRTGLGKAEIWVLAGKT